MKFFCRKFRIELVVLAIFVSSFLLNGCFEKGEPSHNSTNEGKYVSLSKADDSELYSAISSYSTIGDYKQLSVDTEEIEKTRKIHKKWGAESNVVKHFSVKYQKDKDSNRVNVSILKYPTEQDTMTFLESYESSVKSRFGNGEQNAAKENGAVIYTTEKNGKVETTKFTKKVENGVSTFTDQIDGDDGLSFYRKTFCKETFCFQVTEGRLEEDSKAEYSTLLEDIDKIVFAFMEKI